MSEAAGRVVLHDARGDSLAKRGTLVAPGSTLATGPGAKAVVVRGKDFVTVSANSRIRIPTAAQNRGGFDVVQEWGNAVFQIEKKPNPHFGVRTPYLAAVVKGTTFSITVTSEGASLQVVEGAVETSTSDGGARELIRPGIVAMVAAGDRFRLTVQGQDSHSVDSPQRGDPAAPVAPADGSQPEAEQAVPNAGSVSEPQAQESQVISVGIAAEPIDIGRATQGMVGGSTAVQFASADVAALTIPVRASETVSDNLPSTPAAVDPASNGGATASADAGAASGVTAAPNENGSSANSSAGGNSGAGNSSNGNGNSGAGVAIATGGVSADLGNGNGNGNSGAGNNGNANGNAGAGDDAATVVGTVANNGNGNAGSGNNGNGNGNSGTGNNGNGNGNSAESTDAATDVAVVVETGNSGSGNNGNGNGNGNSGSGNNGNGNGNSGSSNNGNGNAAIVDVAVGPVVAIDVGGAGNPNAAVGNGNSNAGTNNGVGNANSNSGNGNGVAVTITTPIVEIGGAVGVGDLGLDPLDLVGLGKGKSGKEKKIKLKDD